MTDFLMVATLKGGVRKTTTAVMLAYAYAARGREVLLIDADTRTQGTTEWMSTVQATQPDGGDLAFTTVQWSRASGEMLVPFVQRWAKSADANLIIADMGAEDPDAIRSALPLVSGVISPVGAEDAELRRLPATRSLLDGVPQAVLLTRVDAVGMGAAADARTALTAAGYHVLTTEVPRNRGVYATVFGTNPPTLGAYETLAVELTEAGV